MVFDSLQYLSFLAVVVIFFYFCRNGMRWQLLLLVSIAFYKMLCPAYLLLTLLLVTCSTYLLAIKISEASNDIKKRSFYWCGVGINLLFLITLKYIPFLKSNLSLLFKFTGYEVHLADGLTFVTIGVSFFVFQAISYLTDVFLELEQPERHFGYFAVYLSFFPKIIQGPIERVGDFIPQLRVSYRFDYDNFRSGMLLIAWGLFNKVVVADRCAMFVNTIYGQPHAYSGAPLVLATYLYAIQIYCDFSGYTCIALGSAKLFNIELTANFNRPYLATSIADFWRRWHISFSRWILDYIFKPLQMKWRHLGKTGTMLALLVTFISCGIWHGASWNFVIWGTMHGLFMVAALIFKPIQEKVHKAISPRFPGLLKAGQIFLTFNLVSFAWVFFRANNLDDGIFIASDVVKSYPDFLSWVYSFLKNMISGKSAIPLYIFDQPWMEFIYMLISILILITASFFRHTEPVRLNFLSPAYRHLRWATYVTLTFITINYGVTGQAPFIYIQF